MRNIIEIENVSKSFGDIKAVNNISLSVREGELFAFLGVNGAGKSTLISVMCGRLSKDSGSVCIDGYDIDKDAEKIKREIGVVFQSSVLDSVLSVRDNLESRAALYGICGKAFEERLDALSELLDFKNILKRPLGKLSGGQRRRIDIARALIHEPKILILDEPTTGLDPGTRELLWRVIHDLRKEKGMTVFLTTHYMEEAADADFVVIIAKGEIIAKGTPLELKNAYAGDYLILYGIDESDVLCLGYPAERIRDGVRITVPSTDAARELILKHPELFKDFEIIKGKMDDVFLNATGTKLSEEGEKND